MAPLVWPAATLVPNASCPIIRGLTATARVLQTAASAPMPPASARRPRRARRPYRGRAHRSAARPGHVVPWGSAGGGVVNVIDNRIPQERQSRRSRRCGWARAAWKPPAAMLSARRPRCWKPDRPLYLHVDGFHRQSGEWARRSTCLVTPAAPPPAPEPSAICRRKTRGVAVAARCLANPRGWCIAQQLPL